MFEHEVDIMLINETNYTNKHSTIKVPGYDCFRRDRTVTGNHNPGGGVLILAKSNLEASEYQLNIAAPANGISGHQN